MFRVIPFTDNLIHGKKGGEISTKKNKAIGYQKEVDDITIDFGNSLDRLFLRA